MRVRRALMSAVLTASVATVTAVAPAASASGGNYVSGGTLVVRAQGVTAADAGVVICDNGAGTGIGGFCLPFGGGDAVGVLDDEAGEDVAFQVCIDNDGDGICTSPDFGDCADFVAFSHDDAGNFYNPVGPLPTEIPDGCGGGYEGYVVFLCEGGHEGAEGAHAHAARTGSGSVTSGGEGSGTFCGGEPINPSRKVYVSDDLPGGSADGFEGGCRADVFADGTDSPQTLNQGALTLLVLARDSSGAPSATASITGAYCELVINGATPGTVVLDAPDGTGITTRTSEFSFNADPDDDVTICLGVTIDGVPYERCEPVNRVDAGSPLGSIGDTDPSRLLASALCPVLSTLTGSYGPVAIDDDGGVLLGGGYVLYCGPSGRDREISVIRRTP